MSLKSKLLAGAAALTLAGGLGAAGLATAGAANAATPSCGPTCLDIFSQNFGTHHNPGFLLDVYKRGQNVGQPIILFRLSNADPAEDFTIADQGTVADFQAAGLASASLALHYGCEPGVNFPNCAPGSADLEAYEIEYAPYGASSGLCMGVAATAVQGEKVSLQPCGVSAKTVWVVDLIDGQLQPGTSVPLINGSDTNFSHPFVLTYPAGSFPTDNPRPQLFVSNLTGFSGEIPPNPSALGVVSDTQLWAADLGQVF
ncbi:MAG TPA: hypothetical protein VFB06_28850 [Streptosporangiaceae bacterium]|nr:hypothetical protein [Streptosporangiaceae bacterium]